MVYISTGTIEGMEPAQMLMSGMKEQFLKSKDARFTLEKTGPATYQATIQLDGSPKTLDIDTVHQHTAGGATLTNSSPLLRVFTGKKTSHSTGGQRWLHCAENVA